MANRIQTIIRTAAMIYAEDQSLQTVKSVRRRFIDAVLVNTDNTPQSIENIISSLQENHKLVVQENDIDSILNDNRYYEVIIGQKKSANTYYLPQKRFLKLKEKSDYTIDDAINEYLIYNPGDKPEELRELLHRYLYSLLNTNIGAYSQLLERKGRISSPVIDSSSFCESEIETINGFIKWDNAPKNRALFEVVNYCIEYASAINSIDPKDVVSALRNKSLYLDNALIYRALGINGSFRMERVLNLLQRCVDSGQKLVISSITRKEFFDTIDYHIGQLRGSTPYGNIDPTLFKKYTGGNTIYQFYHDWRRGKSVYGYEAFRLHITSQYDSLLKRFNIEEDFKQQFNDKDEERIEQYASEIKQFKWQKNDNLNLNDARNIVWLELARKNCDNSVRDTKYYFVTSDRRLQQWDLQHSKNQPITMLPSQWLALLLKYFSRSNDDFKSFVSFLTIPNEKPEVTPEELQDILAGISEITEDFQKQNDIVSALLESDNSRELRNRIEARKFAQDSVERHYKQHIASLQSTYEVSLSKQKDDYEQLLNDIKNERSQEKRERLIERIEKCESQLTDKRRINELINSIADRNKSLVAGVLIGSFVIYVIAITLLIIFVGWDKMEPITFISGLCYALLIGVLSLISNKSIEFWRIPSVIRERSYQKQCAKWSFSVSDIQDLQDTIESLKQQLSDNKN